MNSDREYFDHYWDKGWVVVEGIFDPEEVDRVAALALATAEEERPTAKPGYQLDASADGSQLAPRKLDHVFLRAEGFRKFVLNKRLRELIALFLGERPLLYSDQMLLKPPRFGSAKPYHQDNFYFRCHPDDQVITAWIALDDVDVANGCLRYIDGSHRG